MVEEFMEKIEEWNQPEEIKVNSDYLNNLQENLEYYKTFVKILESEVDFFDESKNDPLEAIENIKNYLEELRGVLH